MKIFERNVMMNKTKEESHGEVLIMRNDASLPDGVYEQ